jgi:hypothetical protein
MSGRLPERNSMPEKHNGMLPPVTAIAHATEKREQQG